MPIATAEQFLAVLERSNLLSPPELAEVRQFAKDYPDAAHLAKALAANDVISRWQAATMLQGRASFFLGRYRLISLLGRGGMGGVFLASHIVMHRKVALKFIPARIARNPLALERFLMEARTIASLDHHNIVRAYSVDNEGDRYYLVMEYVDGMDLQRAVEAYGALEPEAVADYIRQAADGLAHAHARNMIHCDIKPSNLIVTEADGTVKILDMGLARLTHDKPGGGNGNADNQVLGSVDYLAPEQALHSPDFNYRADLYSLGCTMYFLLTGHPPFPTGTLAQKIVKHQTLEPAEILVERPEVPANLAAICKKMMAKNPADRYQTADEVSEVLAAWQPEVPQPAKKTITIKKIESIEDFSAVSPWEQDFGDELKTLASSSGVHEFGLPPGMSGKMPTVKNGASSSTSLKKVFAGTRERLILTSCAIAVLVVFVAGGLILALVFGGRRDGASEDQSVVASSQISETHSPPPPPPVPLHDTTPPAAPEAEKANPPAPAAQESQPPAPAPPDNPPPAAQPAEPPAPKSEVKQEPPPASSDPLKGLPSAIELPPSDGAAAGILLGKVQLDPQAKLQIELVGGDRSIKGANRYALQEDPNSVGGQAWNISRVDPNNKSLPLARLKIRGAELNFDWIDAVPAAQSNPLRNCGITLAIGDGGARFAQFRTPRSADPIVLDVDKGTALVHLRAENLPDADKLKLKVEKLGDPFPKHDVKAEVPWTSSKRMVEINFTEPKFSPVSIYVLYDTGKKDIITLDASVMIKGRPLRLAAAEGTLTKLKTAVAQKERQAAAEKNANQKAILAQAAAAAKTDLEQFTDAVELGKKLNGLKINYRVVADYEKHQVEVFNSMLPPSMETAGAAVLPSSSERAAGKR
jgi:serine/threonine protein kinase